MKALFLAAAIAAAGVAQAAEITIYKQPNFSGDQLTLRGGRTSLTGNFTDQASSAVVHSGHWQVCTQPDFQGECMELGPGEYSQLDSRIFHRVESIRPLEAVASNDRYGYGDGYGYGYDDRSGSIELYAGTAFRGRPVRLNRDAPRIRRGEGIGVGSVVVNDGRWQLCSDPGYRGYCQVLEPGEYDNMGRFNNQVASVRRIG